MARAPAPVSELAVPPSNAVHLCPLLAETLLNYLCLTQVASSQHPSGLKLHSAASFRHEYGCEPSSYPDYLALVGKKEASIKGVGVSAKIAKTLLVK